MRPRVSLREFWRSFIKVMAELCSLVSSTAAILVLPFLVEWGRGDAANPSAWCLCFVFYDAVPVLSSKIGV